MVAKPVRRTRLPITVCPVEEAMDEQNYQLLKCCWYFASNALKTLIRCIPSFYLKVTNEIDPNSTADEGIGHLQWLLKMIS